MLKYPPRKIFLQFILQSHVPHAKCTKCLIVRKIFRFNAVFKELGSTDEGQMCILKSMYDLWSDHQQMVVVLINKMMKTNLLKVSAVANWIFSEEMIRDFTRYTFCFNCIFF